ncbi:MAG: MgtC/SapB family protein [Desulfobacteraceae bacterium]|nr:MgtC/SapB family protein [Desulfobacteraceae bacterium]MBC2756589.1 MgtC/SapB family protein [Desulfobacteraceae bacterium]
MDLSLEIFLKIIYALGIGVLIGLERSLIPPFSATCEPDETGIKSNGAQPAPPEPPDTLLGVRTFSILSLGGFSAALVGSAYPLVAPVIIAGLIVFIIAMYFHSKQEDPGITTEIAAVVCCGLGMLCHTNPHAAGVLALLITVLLALKRFMAKALMQLKRVELTDTLKFLAIILIVLPLLPNRALDPYGAFNPYKVMFLVILISGISFVGYFLTKFLGAEKGLGLTGLFGGLTSSTAVTAAMATQAKQAPGLTTACAFATIIANATMFCRVLVVVAILDWTLMTHLVWSIGTMTVAATIAVIFLWLRSKNNSSDGKSDASREISLENPFSLGPAIKFSLFFVLILFVAKIAKIYLGDKGLYLASLVSGLADVDAITLSIAEQTKAVALTHAVGAVGITIAVVANSIVKSGIAVYSGGWRFGSLVGAILLGATGAGLGVLLIF